MYHEKNEYELLDFAVHRVKELLGIESNFFEEQDQEDQQQSSFISTRG